MLAGTVVQYSREFIWVILDDGGREVLAKPRGRIELLEQERARRAEENLEPEKVVTQLVTVGDRVELTETEHGWFAIETLLERETWLLRKGNRRYRRKPQCIVANADQLAVVAAPNPVIRPSMIDRFFLAAIQGGLTPLLLVNKIDVDPTLPDNPALRDYRELGYQVFFLQATTGRGLTELGAVLKGKFTVFCGHSGVGKSTILSRLTGVEIRTAEVKAKSLKGRQTTTSARLYALPEGGAVVDTPGIREFGLAHLTWLDVHEYFTRIATLATACAFRDCTHTVEPDCAVRQAVAAGRLSAERVKSYIKLRKETEDFKHWE
ncbi:ribosome small subunit-dependent GTPase A [bacterium]|nr:ribosome small subunit-dependent GTPase A [bacterium]